MNGFKSKIAYSFALLALFCFVFSNCEMPMGMGNTIDFEEPILRVTHIVLPDGAEFAVAEEDNKLFVGPGILVGPGFKIKGKVWDNVGIEWIQVDEIGSNALPAVDNDGKPAPIQWKEAQLEARSAEGWQDWSMTLDGIRAGERTIKITAYDKRPNIGPDTEKQLTLIIDTEPPFVEKVEIERAPGLIVSLLSRARLEGMDPNVFENIDYFQNESFTIRASIYHNFDLSDVWLNFIDETGRILFGEGMTPVDINNLYGPVWHVNTNDLVAADQKYATGRHYFNVMITARARAGHSNENRTNILYNLCWYPEADNPRIYVNDKNMVSGTTYIKEKIMAEKDGTMPIRVFDDDNVQEAYAIMVSQTTWDAYLSGQGFTDEERVNSLYSKSARDAVTTLTSPSNPKGWVSLDREARNSILSIQAGSDRGQYRILTAARDSSDKWTFGLFEAEIQEEGVPIINVYSPLANTIPDVIAGTTNFTLEGSVLNLDAVDFLKLAWLPVTPAALTDAQMTIVQNALREHSGQDDAYPVTVDGVRVKIWHLDVSNVTTPSDPALSKFREQAFSKTFNVLTDFNLDAATRENETKHFILYTKGVSKEQVEVFYDFRVLPFTTAPQIVFTNPNAIGSISMGNGADFQLVFRLDSALTVNTADVSITRNPAGTNLNYQRNGNIFTANTIANVSADFSLLVKAADIMGNYAEREFIVKVIVPPSWQRFSSPHATNTTFSTNPENGGVKVPRQGVTIQAVFDGPVGSVTGVPRLVLGGITTTPAGGVRYANYESGQGTSTLNFVYEVLEGDRTTTTAGINVQRLELNGGTIDGLALPTTTASRVIDKNLLVDGVAPTITGIAFSGNGDTDYAPWLKAGNTLTVEVTANKDLRVMGSPELILPFNSRTAVFQKMDGARKMIFAYVIQPGDNAEINTYAAAGAFSSASLDDITDTAGSAGNKLSLSGGYSASNTNPGLIRIDTTPPAALWTNMTNDTATRKDFAIRTAQIEAGATVQYTLDGGATGWLPIASPYTFYETAPTTGQKSYNVKSRQIDRAGNVGDSDNNHAFQMGDTCDLLVVSCDNPDGAYKNGSVLTFKLIFSGRITNTSTASMVLAPATQGTSTAAERTVNFTYQNEFTLVGTWTANIPVIMDPVSITSINIANVRKISDGQPVTTATGPIVSAYNTTRDAVKVFAIIPTITQINGAAPGNNATIVAPVSGDSILTLTFSHPVWAQKGNIVIRPAANWRIPPVISNSGYTKIENALSGTNLGYMTNNYKRTTHGLKVSGSYYVPDTDTKYVLNFDLGIDGTTGPTANVRGALEAAGYLRQEIEVVSTDQVGTTGAAQITLPPESRMRRARRQSA